jgi:hypothetical protein
VPISNVAEWWLPAILAAARRQHSVEPYKQKTDIHFKGECGMTRQNVLIVACLLGLFALADTPKAQAQQPPQAYGRQWANSYSTQDWNRFYHYPYVYYPQNFYGDDYYRSSESLYYRYPSEMRIPVYNKQWHNYYPEGRLYHSGHHFVLDVF